MFTLRPWFSRSDDLSTAARRPASAGTSRPAAVEPLEGRALMSASLLPAVQHPSYSLGTSNPVTGGGGASSITAPAAGSTNIIGVLIAL